MARRTQKQEQRDPNMVARGSDRHASMLLLRKADEHDDQELVIDGWTLADLTRYGPSATTRFLKRILVQKVNELKSEIPVMQSDDPLAPNYALPMWNPDRPVDQVVPNEDEILAAVEVLKKAGVIT